MNTTARQALRIARAICITTGLALLVAGRFIWQHRAEIRAAIVAAIAATYVAGAATRHAVDHLSRRSCTLLQAQPLPAVAPITATLQAAREALARLIARLYREPAAA